jgi:hypothetical protein
MRFTRLAIPGLVLLLGCGGWPFAREAPGPAGDPSYGVAEASSEGAALFYERSSTFYARLARRRFNTLSTFQDEALRDFFQDEDSFSDYYADLAQDLVEAHFEQNRPLALRVVEFRLGAPGEATVVTRIIGNNGLPLRRGQTTLEREDRWERLQGTWWLVPGRL